MATRRAPRSVYPWAAALVAPLAIVILFAVPARTQSLPPSSGGLYPSPEQARTTPVATVKPDAKKAKEAFQKGIRAERAQDWQTAYTAYSDAANWAPNKRQYFLLREVARSRLVQSKMDIAERDAVSGRLDAARRELLAASYLDPSNTVVRERLTELTAAEPGQVPRMKEPDITGEVQLAYQPGKRNFDYRGDTQGAYEELARQFGVEVAFDVDLRSRPVLFRVGELDFPTAARLLGDMTGTFWRPLSRRLFFVTENTPQKRRDYQASVVRTVLLPASETPEQMTEMLRLVREIAGITRSDLDTRSRTLTLRASPRAIAVATDLVDELEKPVGELILEIEILEVDRNQARQLGIVPPQTARAFSLSAQQIQQAQQSFEGLVSVISQVFGLPSSLSGLTPSQISSLLSSGQVGLGALLPPLVAFGGGRTTFLANLPGAAANYSQLLSLVQHGRRILLRAQDGQPATFFVGERIPVSLATFSPSIAGTGANVPGITSTNFPATNYPAGNAPAFVTAASLRNNGTDDLIVANSADDTISILLGRGDGTFSPATPPTFPTGTDPVWIAAGDFNNDTRLDLAIANKGSNTVSILLGNGDGTFQAGTPVATGNSPVSVVAANFHDSTPNSSLNLAVANQGDNTISIFQGNGDGTFAVSPTVIQLPTGFSPAALAAADFNHDGHIDLAVADQGNNTVSIFLGRGDGTFQTRVDYPTGNSPVWVSTGDFNGDNVLDLAVANQSDNTVSILLGKGDGTFVPAANPAVPAGLAPTSIAVGDYNVDGRLDLAVADQTDNAVSVLLNLGGGLFGPNFKLSVGTAPASIVSADFNGDGRPDVATANSGSSNASVILNSSSFSGATNGLAGVPFPGVQYLDIGLKVKATPRIHPNDEVTLQLSFDISSLTSQSFNSIPVISNQSVTQTVRLKENQTAALAGFLESQVTNAITGTPGIVGLPGIGWLGQNQNLQTQDSELLILVTPRMVRFAPRADHSFYAGQGELEGPGGGAGPAGFAPAREEPRVAQPLPQAPPASRGQPPPQPEPQRRP
jgi:Bacterial type II and III secretion system protein/FG-GAP-like repeat